MSNENYSLRNDPDFERRKAKYAPVAQALEAMYGRPQWQPQDFTPLDELIECILSQSTSDTNRDRGFEGLKTAFPTWEAVMDAPVEALIEAIRPAGLANQKAPRIQQILRRIYAERGELSIDFLGKLELEAARKWLIDLDGVGPKTAAIVLCFAFNRPAFPVDTHIHRVGLRIGFLPPRMNAENSHPYMESIIPPADYYPFHLQLIWHGRQVCQARQPVCERCPLREQCDYYQQIAKA